ncbi:MAG: DUF2334 domain-containing protein [Butyrivibrio sp.]|nr:DUF2334 domain-containing protein [Butyrivibrio sp.]
MSYILRLDDAAPRMNHFKWQIIEKLLRKYNIHPLIGIIPDVQDEELIIYEEDKNFWQKAKEWQTSGFAHLALHGYQHVYQTKCAGINPVNQRSEFAGVSLSKQIKMLQAGYDKLRLEGIDTDVFFAPAHTFDDNTIKALKAVTPIRIISDTIANDVYERDGIVYVPQQSGRCRKLPFKVTTFCYHPNEMVPADFVYLEKFLARYAKEFVDFASVLKDRPYGKLDKALHEIYFYRKKRRQKRG